MIENNTFHDYIYHGGGPHFECWWIAGGTNITFDGNKFYNCQTNGVSLGDMGNDANTAGTWYFQNNWCSNSLNQGCFKFGQLPYAATMIFRFNSFAAGRTITNEEPTNIANPNEIYIVGNVLGTSDNMGGINCIQNAVYDYNVELQGGNNQGCGNHRTIIELAALHQPRQPPRRRLPPQRQPQLISSRQLRSALGRVLRAPLRPRHQPTATRPQPRRRSFRAVAATSLALSHGHGDQLVALNPRQRDHGSAQSRRRLPPPYGVAWSRGARIVERGTCARSRAADDEWECATRRDHRVREQRALAQSMSHVGVRALRRS